MYYDSNPVLTNINSHSQYVQYSFSPPTEVTGQIVLQARRKENHLCKWANMLGNDIYLLP